MSRAPVTVPDQTPQVAFAASAVAATDFPFSFPYWEDEDLVVRTRPVDGDWTVRTDYDVVPDSGTESTGYPSGKVVFTAAASNVEVVIRREKTFERISQFPAGTGLDVPALNRDVNRATGLMQTLRMDMDRALKLPVDLAAYGDNALVSGDRADKVLGFDNSGVPELRPVDQDADPRSLISYDEAASLTPRFSGEVIDAYWTSAYWEHAGDGTTTVFSISGAISASARNYLVTLNGVRQTPDDDYTIDVSGVPTAATITFTTAPVSSVDRIVIQSALAYSHQTNQYYVATVAQLIDLNASDGAVVLVAEEGRGGTFVYDSAQAAVNNGGTVFNGWVRQYSGAVDVRWFGAVADWNGSAGTDNTSALVAAVAGLSDGDSLLVSDGQYLFNPSAAPLTIVANNIRVVGAGRIVASNSVEKVVVLITGDGVTWDGPEIEGDGTVYAAFTPGDEANRWALLRVEGDNAHVKSGQFLNPYLNGIHANACDNLVVGSGVSVFGGPVAAAVATYFQAIRIYTCTNWRIDGAYIGANALGGKPEEGVFASQGSNGFVRLSCSAAWDHGVYAVGVDGLTIHGCATVTDQAGIACSPPEYRNNKTAQTIISGNRIEASVTVSSDVGCYLRDMHNAVIQGNLVRGFPRSYQMSPVQYSHADNRMEGIVFADNVARDWLEFGLIVAAAGLLIGKVQNLRITGLDSIPASAALTTGSAHILSTMSAGILNNIQIEGNTLGSNGSFYAERGIVLHNGANLSIANNTILSVSDHGIELSGCDDYRIESNYLADAGTTAIELISVCTGGEVSRNDILDGPLYVMAYGIDGNNNVARTVFADNRIIGAGTVPIRRCQFTGNTNDFRGNRTGADPLIGVVTLAASITTLINNDNVNALGGYTSRIRLSPLEATAAALVGGANSPYCQAGDYVVGTSFRVRQAGAAAGTEQFLYEIVQ